MKIIVVLLAALAVTQGEVELVNGKVKISTVTTSGCSDTVNFIQNQLAPTYAKYGEFIELEFIPWGRTIKNANGFLTCQFGVQDCWANQLHRCVAELATDQGELMNYFLCEFSPPHPSYLYNSYECVAKYTSLNIVDVDYCTRTADPEAIEDKYQALAERPMAIINFVPSIFFNDVIDVNLHTQARSRLESMVCFALASDPASTGVEYCNM